MLGIIAHPAAGCKAKPVEHGTGTVVARELSVPVFIAR
jgi:hypothetical protein